MKKYIYIIVCAAFAATLHSCSSEVEGVDDTDTAITTDDITVAPFPAFGDVQTRSTDAGAGHDKTSWEDGDVIYIQLNGKDSWYAMKYNGSEWTFPTDDFPGMYREDTYKAVYAPNYEPNGSSLVLKDGAQPATAEYLTCEGKKPINISFNRNYARIRIYTGGVTIATKFTPGSFKANDGYTYTESSYDYELKPDDNGNVCIYGTWETAESAPSFEFAMNMGDYTMPEYLSISAATNGGKLATASSANRSYAINCEWLLTIDLDKGAQTVTDWTPFTDKGITKIKMIGTWGSDNSNFTSFSVIPNQWSYFDGYDKITSIDISEVKNMGDDMPEYFFYECGKLSEVKLPNDLTKIPSYAFASCNNLAKIEIPSGVRTISSYAFQYCSNLEKIEIPSGVTTIEEKTFSYCGLKSVTIPSSLTRISEYAFEWNQSLSRVICYAQNPPSFVRSAFYGISCSKTLYVPDNYINTYLNQFSAVDYVWNDEFDIKSISEMPKDE
jgi:hypothetical protein